MGRVPLYLLDSNVDENSPADRQLTARLYSNDLEIRISQEILLGMGGVRALRLLGYQPGYLAHERRPLGLPDAGARAANMWPPAMTYAQASEKVRQTNIFTTHTPVPAGNDQFPLWLIDKYFAQLWPQLGLDRDQFIDLGRQPQPWGDSFVMPVLALKLSEKRNARL